MGPDIEREIPQRQRLRARGLVGDGMAMAQRLGCMCQALATVLGLPREKESNGEFRVERPGGVRLCLSVALVVVKRSGKCAADAG